jgi:hypothetical protein
MISRKELAFNASRWMDTLKREIPEAGELSNLGGMFFFFDRRDPEGSATVVANINPEGVIAACRGILRKLGKDPDSVIINPFERN